MAIDPMKIEAPAEPLGLIQLPDLPETPDAILAEWLPSNGEPARPLMTLATLDEDGMPDARSVLLTEFSGDGFWFHTDLDSRKTDQLAAHPAAALVFAWPERRRQLVVRGIVEPADAEEAARAFRARSPYLQQLAWQNTDEFAALPYAERTAAWAAFAAEHPEGFAAPATWVGYLVRPLRVTFWTGSPEAPGRRAEYSRAAVDDPWTVTILAG
jgi:pyridoxamine 5'-phosphate oxidase